MDKTDIAAVIALVALAAFMLTAFFVSVHRDNNVKDDLARRGFVEVKHKGLQVWVPADRMSDLLVPVPAEAKP